MDFWTAIVLIVAIGVISEMYKARIQTSGRQGRLEEQLAGLADQVRRLEERVVNMETLVLEHEQHRRFDEKLGQP